MILLCWVQLAFALDWSPTTWRAESDRDGVLTLGAGMPLRLSAARQVTLPDGREVHLRASASDWWVDPAPTTRYLRVDDDTDLALFEVDPRQWNADWAAWEHDAALALAGNDPVPVPPDGISSVSAKIQLRARAVGRRTALLGLLSDVAAHRGLSRLGRDRATRERREVLEPGEVLDLDVSGAVKLGVRPMTGVFERIRVGVDRQTWPIASTGTSSTTRRILRARGGPALHLQADAEVPVELLYSTERVRLWAALPGIAKRPTAGIEQAEWDTLHGLDVDFTPWLEAEDPGIAGWARVRQIERASGAELLTLCDPAVPGDDAVAHAVLSRAADLPIDVPLDWLEQVDRPDPRVLAAWLDGQQASRPHGLALLERARRGRAGERQLASDQVRHAAMHTRWVALSSDRDAEGTWRFAADGTGLPRMQIGPGTTARLTVATADPVLREAVRWTADEGTRFLLDGRPVEGTGVLRFGLPAGEHVVDVQAGRLLVPRTGWEGGQPGVGWRAVPLPATFDLPGAGAPIELRLNTEGPVRLVFDDGRVTPMSPPATTIFAGPTAKSMRVEGEGTVGVAARLVRVEDTSPVTFDGSQALQRIRDTTDRIDAGDLRARADRAVALAVLGRRRQAWTDVSELADVDGALYRKAWSQVMGIPVVTEQTGPLDAFTASALGNDAEAAALAELEAGNRTEAIVLAAGSGADQVLDRALAGMSWKPVQRMDRGAGLTPIELSARAPRDGLRADVERALVRSPWEEGQTVVVREGAVDRVVTPRKGLTLDVWCRDLSLRRSPCALEAIGATTPGAVVSDGDRATIVVDGNSAEIGPVDPEQVVVVQAYDVAGPLLAGVRRLAFAVNGRSSVRLPAGRLVRLEVLSGNVETTATPVADVDGRPIVRPDGELVLTGRGTVVVQISDPREQPEETFVVERPTRPRPTGLLQVDDLWPRLDRAEHRVLPPGPTLRVQLSGVISLDGQFRERWTAGEVEVAAYRAGTRGWSFAEAWLRGPGGAGLSLESGLRAGRLLLSARAFGATTLQGDAGEVGIQGHARLDSGPRRLWVRADVWPRIAFVSLQPRRTVDPRVWTRYRLTHFAGVDARLSALSEPTRDLRIRAFVQANSNAGPSLDRVRVGSRADLLLRRRTRIYLTSHLDGVFADVDRPTGRITPTYGGGLDHDWWIDDRRWMLFAMATSNPRGDLGAQLGLSVHGTRGRGLRDAPPTRDLFRTEREGR